MYLRAAQATRGWAAAQRREDLAKKLQLEKYPDPEEAMAAAAARARPRAAPAVDMFDCDGFTTTVTTIAMNSDDDDDRCSAGLLGGFPVHHDRSS